MRVKKDSPKAVLIDQYHCVSRNTEPFARKAEMLLGRCFDADAANINAEHVGIHGAHRADIRLELGSLRYDCAVDVHDDEALFLYELYHLAQHLYAVGVEVSVVTVRKHSAYIAHRHRTEQRVHERVSQNVGVGMTEQTLFVWNFYAAEYQISVGNELMDIISVTYAQYFPLLSARMPSAI